MVICLAIKYDFPFVSHTPLGDRMFPISIVQIFAQQLAGSEFNIKSN